MSTTAFEAEAIFSHITHWRSPRAAVDEAASEPGVGDRVILTLAYSEASRILVDVRQLRYFKCIADQGSLSQAAFKLNVVQSTLSHNLAQVEEELGVQLFLRRPRGVELTEAGRKLYDYVEQVLDVLNEAREEVAATAHSVSGNIWIGLNHTATSLVSLPVLKSLIERHEDLRVGLIEDLSGTLIEHLMDRNIDIAVAFNPPEDPRIVSTPLFDENVCCVGIPELVPDTGETIPFAEVEKLPLLLAGQGPNLRGIVSNELLARRLKEGCVAEITSLNAMLQALKEGLGCTLLSASTVHEQLEAGELVARRIVEPEIVHSLNVSFLADGDHKLLTGKVVQVIRQQIDDVIACGRYDIRSA